MKRINLIPSEAKKITPRKWLKNYFLKTRTRKVLGLFVVGFILFNLWQASSYLRYKFSVVQGKKNINKLQARLTQSQDMYAKIKTEKQAIEKETRRVEERLRVLRQAQLEKSILAKVLAHLSKFIPADLWVNNVKLNNEMLTIVGTTFDHDIISRFMAKLDESGYFKDTTFNYTQKNELKEKPVINFEVITYIVPEKIRK